MKYIFIAGLEHSGTTLVNHLLSQHPGTIGLGEIAPFFSPDHMKQYMVRWGKYTESRLCSCGETWGECSFWSDIIELNGLNSDRPLLDKYQRLVQHVRSNYPEKKIIIDSSKSCLCLQTLVDHCDEIGLKRDDILVVFSIKDVRSFAASMGNKTANKSILSTLKAFNLWMNVNNSVFSYLKSQKLPHNVVLYEKLCADPRRYVEGILEQCGVSFNEEVELNHNRSHIAMGNKQFILRNRNGLDK